MELGKDIGTVCELLELKKDTVIKAIKAGRVIIPSKTKDHQLDTTKSQRSVIDDNQTMGKACGNTMKEY